MVVDANVPIYWSIPCPFTISASKIMMREDLCAPDFLLSETANGLMKYVRAGLLHFDQFKDGMELIRDAIADFVPDGSLLQRAAEIAFEENHKVYDCLYLALALEKNRPLATADKRLASLAGKYEVAVELIEPQP